MICEDVCVHCARRGVVEEMHVRSAVRLFPVGQAVATVQEHKTSQRRKRWFINAYADKDYWMLVVEGLTIAICVQNCCGR